ncbi:MAG TPA: DNA alkylation repair protein [Candidatus Limnocylindria bacterium]|nr:DNA alkylation repair protein [Candidatus Limnocylindria bacterium]
MTLATLSDELRTLADPSRAAQMQAYMKSAMPYHGVPMPVLRQVCRRLFAGRQWATAEAWTDEVLAVWRDAAYREERYAALALAGHRAARAFQVPAAMPLYEELVVSGAWWDLVDDVATHRIGPILRAHPVAMRPVILEWSRSDHVWKRRASIICQVGARDAIDRDLLFACIEPSLGSREFFLRKAIGWALRELSKTDPDAVRAYVDANAERMSGLSRREATRRLAPSA